MSSPHPQQTQGHHLPSSPHNPYPLSPRHPNQFHPAALARAASSNRSVASGSGGSAGGHSRDSSHSQGTPLNTAYMHQPQSLTAAAAAAAANRRLGANGGSGAGPYGHASSSPSPSRSSFGADSVSGLSATSGFMSRPPLRGTLSDGLQPGATSQYGNAFTPPLYSSGSAAGSASNLSSSLHPPSLVHSLSNSSLNSAVASSVTSPLMGPNAGSFEVSPFNIQSQQSNSEVPPFQGPLSANDPRTSLLVLNLPYKVRWQDLKDLFRRSAGTVLRADVSLTPDGRSRGFGSVLMRDAEDAHKAKECFDGFEWMGRRLEVTIERGGGGGWGSLSNAAAVGASPLGHHMLPGAHYNQSSQEGLPIPLTFGASGAQVGSKPTLPHMVSGLDPMDYTGQSLHTGAALRSPQALALQNAKHHQYGQHPNGRQQGHPQNHHHLPGRSPSMLPTDRPQMPPHLDSGNGYGQSGGDYLGVPHSHNAASPAVPALTSQVQQLRSASFSSSSSGRRLSSSNSSISPPFFSGQATPNTLAVPTAGQPGAQSPNLPAPPFPPAAPSPSASSSLPPGAIPTQHQLAVLSAQAAQAAVAAQQAKVVAENGGMPDGSYYGRTLFVGNLSYATQWQDLKDLFRSAGNIVRADIALSPEGRSRGFGTALFGTKDEAARAVRMFHGYDHNGRTLKVHFDRFARMEAPPMGVLVPARVEDYTSAFNAAQPPSNVGGVAGGSKTAGGPAVQPSQSHSMGPMSQQAMHPDQAMMQMQIQMQMQHGAQPYLQHGAHSLSQASSPLNPSLGATPRGSISQASGLSNHMPDQRTSPLPPRQQPFQPTLQPTLQPRPQPQQNQSQNRFQYQHGGSYEPSSDGHGGERTASAGQLPTEDSSAPHADAESSRASSNGQEQTPASSNRALSSSGPSAHPGRIRLPSPPSIPQHFHPYPHHGATATFSPAQGRAPMPMTPGVPLTPGMPGFTFAGMPPQTPPAFAAPFMSPGLGLMSPGIPGHPSSGVPTMMATTPGAGPPTPWQLHGISAAPGAPLRMAPPPGQATPRGAANANFNPFFANAIPGAAYPYQAQPGGRQMPPTPGWNQPPRPAQPHGRGYSTHQGEPGSQKRARDPQHQGCQEPELSAPVNDGAGDLQQVNSLGPQGGDPEGPRSTGAFNESAVSSRSASPAHVADQLDGGYPFPAVTPGGAVHMDEQDEHSQTQKPSSAGTAGKPTAIAGFPLISRRASTNSPAVSPGVFGLPPGNSNARFGYFAAAMVSSGLGSSSQARGSGYSDESGDGQYGFPNHAQRDRRPSLDASALRTPMRDEPARGGYFNSVDGRGGDDAVEAPERTGVDSQAPSNAVSPNAAASPAGQYHGRYGGGKEGSLDGRSPDSGSASGSAHSGSLPKIAIAAGHQSTEEMARAIAKMSIEGKALRRAAANPGGYNGAAPGSVSMSASASASSRPELGGRSSSSGTGTPVTFERGTAVSPAEKKSA